MTDSAPAVLGPGYTNAVARVVTLKPDPSILNAIGRGHTLASAIADIIDNALDAGAEQIGVRFLVRDGFVQGLRVRDNGTGMTAESLRSAMTLGKRRDYEAGALGHFGIGLKASSLSQARTLTVFTRCDTEDIAAMRLHRSSEVDDFTGEVLTARAARDGFELDQRAGLLSTGTVIDWRGLESASASGLLAERRAWLGKTVTSLRGYLGLIFHRLLAERRIRIEIDEYDLDHGESGAQYGVDPIDPFAFQMSGATGFPTEISGQTASGAELIARCFVLPPNSHAPTARLHGRPRAEWQGIYVYRNDRLLQAGGWGSIATSSDDLQLARVAVELDDSLLASVSMNPEKKGVILRPDFVHALESAVDVTGEITFHSYLEVARQALKLSNKREVKIKPVTPVAYGLSGPVEDTIADQLGYRSDVSPFAIRWRILEENRLFRFGGAERTLWLNAGYRAQLTGSSAGLVNDAPLLKSMLFLLMEGHFAKDRIQQITQDQIEAWQDVLAAAMAQQIDVRQFDPAGWEDADLAQVDLFSSEQVVVLDDRPNPGKLARYLSESAMGVTHKTANESPDDGGETEVEFDEHEDEDGVSQIGADIRGATDDQIADYLAGLSRTPLLSAEEEVSLAMRIESGIIAEARHEAGSSEVRQSALGEELRMLRADGSRAKTHMITANLRLVVSIAKRYTGRGLAFMDLIQEGNIGLIRAVEKFDYREGTKFSTYATWWIRQSVTRALADQARTIRVPVHVVDSINQLRATIRTLSGPAVNVPTLNEIADASRMEPAEVTRLLRYDEACRSLDEIVGIDEGGDIALGELLVDEMQVTPEELLESAFMERHLEWLLGSLTEREAGVLRMRFGFGVEKALTLDQIGDVFDVTRERIRQIEGKAMKKLRESALSEQLRDYVQMELPRSKHDLLSNSSLSSGRPIQINSVSAGSSRIDSSPRRGLPGAGYVSETESHLTPVGQTSDESQPHIAAGVHDVKNEDLQLVNGYRANATIAELASALGWERRAVAIRLTQILLGEEGDLEDESVAPRHGVLYTPDERERILLEFRRGTSLSRIATDVGRTRLAVAWQLLESPRQPIMVTRKILKSVRRSSGADW